MVRVRLNLNNITSSTTLPQNFNFVNCDKITNCTLEFSRIRFYNQTIEVDSVTYSKSDIKTISTTETYIDFNCFIDLELTDINSLITLGILEFNVDGTTMMYLYKQNSKNICLTKTLTLVDIISGRFNGVIGLKNLTIDIHATYDDSNYFNYVWIPKLNRYYYVDRVDFISADFMRLYLKEDVLMSHSALIKQQTAMVNRWSLATNKLLVDERYPLEDVPSIYYYYPANVSGSPIIELSYNMPKIPDTTSFAPNVLVTTVGDVTSIIPDDSDSITAPTDSGLPNIQSRRGNYKHHYLLNIQEYNSIINACINQDAPATFIHSVLLLPFDLRDVFPDATKTHSLYAGKKQLLYTGWGDPTSDPAPEFFETKKGGSPYIVIADFYFNSSLGGINISNSYLDFSPNTQWEIYVPFVGWVQIDVKALFNKRVMIYYTFDFDTGISTAYIYNRTNAKVIHSCSCQIGMRLPIAVTNADELARQKQATGLNLLMGLLTSALSIGVGAYSGNAVAVMGGIMGAGKTITGAVNSFNSMIEKANLSYGSSDNALYSPYAVSIRKTIHEKVITTTTEEDNFKNSNGYPYKKTISLTSITGYVEIGKIDFDPKAYNIYQDEITEIVQLLQSGVIF